MPAEHHYRKLAQQLDWAGLSQLWKDICAGRTSPQWAPGKALEYLVLRAFELDGASVVWPFNVTKLGMTVEQIDGVIYTKELSVLSECKDYATPVDFGPIAKLRAQLDQRPMATIGCFFSRSGFTDPALWHVQVASPKNVLLWYGDEIDYVLEKREILKALVRKYRFAVERALPDYKINRQAIV